MVLVTGNWRLWLAGMAASLAIFGVLYFTVIKPNSDTANQALKSGLQQSQQVISQAKKQINAAGAQSNGQAAAAVSTANTQLSKAAKLTACVQAAGTDAGKIQSCQVKFG